MSKRKAAKQVSDAARKPKKSHAGKDRPARSPLPAVRVRMFRHGLGDCFLITFDAGGDERHMLIDCGTLGSSREDARKVKTPDIADVIRKTIGPGGRLNLVVATHEHQDHLSGFNNKEMRTLKGLVDHVWLAWTENPTDPDAQKFARNKKDLGEALALLVQAFPHTDVGVQVRDLLGFAGDTSTLDDTALGAAKFAETVNNAMEFVRAGLGAKVEYREPGQMIEAEWLPRFRFYVLGPPRSPDLIKQLGDRGSSELYGLAAGLRSAAVRHLTASQQNAEPLSMDEQLECELEHPFDSQFTLEGTAGEGELYPAYVAPENRWRAMTNDWLSLGSDLALQLDSLTNNSSLALAIERIAHGKVLLFPADAQQGNWVSWHDAGIHWTVPSAEGTRKVDAASLLSRTVFYKTGHHGSHNATLRAKGLELMTSKGELVAFIPVDRAVALTRNPKDSWQMPARPLYRRLLEQCEGRVARSDLGWATKPAGKVEKEFEGMATDAEWRDWSARQTAATHVRIDDQFVEYVLN